MNSCYSPVVKSSGLVRHLASIFTGFAPLALADTTWDNVGILIDCPDNYSPKKIYHQKPTILLTVDVTHEIIDEAIKYSYQGTVPVVILAYHPMIFKPIKKLTLDPSEDGYSHINGLVLRCIQSGISVFSPHTALDNCVDGSKSFTLNSIVNDWICSIIGNGEISPIVSSPLTQSVNARQVDTGSGRYIALQEKITLPELTDRLMKGFGVKYARVARGFNREYPSIVSKIAICAGSGMEGVADLLGSSILLSSKLHQDTDVLVTGEMSHHDVLAAVSKGFNVVLFEHSHTERGYLSCILKKKLEQNFGKDVQIVIASADKDPIELEILQ